jgi:hypothetical protein
VSPPPPPPRNPTHEQAEALQRAERHLRRNPAERDAALGMLIDGGFSAAQAWRILEGLLPGGGS